MRNFWSDRKGNIAVLFALAIVPVIGGIGAAVDYSMASAYRTDMQKALDSTALALSKILPADEATVQTIGMQYFTASMGQHSLTGLTLDIIPALGKVNLRVTADFTPAIAKVFGADKFQIGANAEAVWGVGKVEVALVLDNSGSMSDYSRMTHLKTAAHDLLNILKNAAREPEDAKVAIVTFDQRVNVGTSNKNATWLRWNLWEAANGSCTKSGYNSESSCTNQKVCTKPRYTSKNSCQNNGGTWQDATWTPANHDTWTGCVEDRNKDNDVSDAAPSGTATRYPAAQCAHGLWYPGTVTELRALTIDWVALGTTIDAMQPSGYTNIAIGLAWGWHLLSPTDVFTEGKAYNTENLSKYVILMTDGDNTQNRFGDSTSTMNTRVSTVCTNMKTAGVKIFTIRLVSGNATLLSNCATSPSMYYDVQDAGQLAGVFNAIGTEIASLHLAR